MVVVIDFETRSELDLKKSGTFVYSDDSSTDILCMAYQVDDQPPGLWIPTNPLPDFMKKITRDTIFVAHNALFEHCIWNAVGIKKYHFPNIHASQWCCTMQMALSLGLPRSLKLCALALNLSMQKDSEGRRMMLKFCKPRKPTKNNPEKWHNNAEDLEKVYSYCVRDVVVEKALYDRLVTHHANALEGDLKQLNDHINRRGIFVDLKAVHDALIIIKKNKAQVDTEINTLTNGFVKTANQRDAVMKWCNDQGYTLNAYDAAAVEQALNDPDIPSNVKRVLAIRKSQSKSSTAKYIRLAKMTSRDQRLRGLFNYHGAITGRWSSNGVQLHNLPRGHLNDPEAAIEQLAFHDPDWLTILYDDPMRMLSSCLRSVFCAPENKVLIGGDFNAIETRVLWWLAKEHHGLDLFKKGADPYKDIASYIFRKPVNTINADERRLGKATILGCGYGMGAEKFRQTCANQDIAISEAMAKKVVNAYRQHYPNVKRFWARLEKKVRRDVTTKKFTPPFYRLKLPSGRAIHYFKPHVSMNSTSWGELRLQLAYEGTNSNGSKGVIHTYGGKLVENVVQATARDILADAMLRLDKHGFDIVLHVHDEIVCEVDEKDADKKLAEFNQLMSMSPAWCRDLPLKVETWQRQRYCK